MTLIACPPKAEAETAPLSSYPRINTWSGGLNEMEEAGLAICVSDLGYCECIFFVCFSMVVDKS